MRILHLAAFTAVAVGVVLNCQRRDEPTFGTGANGGSGGNGSAPATGGGASTSGGASSGGSVNSAAGAAEGFAAGPSAGAAPGGGAPNGPGAAAGAGATRPIEGTGGEMVEPEPPPPPGPTTPPPPEPPPEPPPPSPNTGGTSWAPPQHAKLPLAILREGLGLYVPHQASAATVKGSTHTHAAPDHSDMDPAEQEARLRDLPPPHKHDFVWLTAHNFVAPNPNVAGVLHMFGVEVYTKQPSGAAPHVLALLPNGNLADEDAMPFGYYSKDIMGAAAAIRAAGGLPSLAHPMRYPIPDADAAALDERLWGIEVLSGTSVAEESLAFADAFLSRGKYACLTAGGDIHDEDWSLTRGYIVVSVAHKPPTMSELFAATSACNFFACQAQNEHSAVVDPPTLRVEGDHIVFTSSSPARLRFVGRGGNVLSQVASATSATYAPKGDELYVRAEALGGGGRCYSQPLWLVTM